MPQYPGPVSRSGHPRQQGKTLTSFAVGDRVVGQYTPTVGVVKAVTTSTTWGETLTTCTVRWHGATWDSLQDARHLRHAGPCAAAVARGAWRRLLTRYRQLIR